MSKESFYITTPIYYVNSVPHLGTAYTTIAADVVARYRRLAGYDVFFLTGTDEHGQKVEEAAQKNDMSPQEWVDTLSEKFKETWELLNISHDEFIRTTEPRHIVAVQKLVNLLYDSGDIYKGEYEGWYCVPDETYWASADVSDDQTCPECGRKLQFVKEENYFFKLSAYQQRLLDYYEAHPAFIGPETRKNEVLSFVTGGLRDLSISRSNVSWGIELPWDTSHTVYVWFDALINYLTGVGFGDPTRDEELAHRWPAQTQFVGKDIIRFHCVIWPAMLMAAGIELPEHIFAHGFLLTKGEKMSKSRGNAITPAGLAEQFGVDGYRYYFMRDVAFGQDGSVSVEAMTQRYNGDLANDWGNLCSRLFNMVGKYCDGLVPALDLEANVTTPAPSTDLTDRAEQLFDAYEKRMAKYDFAGALDLAWGLIKATNRYIEENAPWALAKEEVDAPRLHAVLYNALESVRICALYTAAVMPATSQEIWKRMGLDDILKVDDLKAQTVWGQLPAGNIVVKGDALFPRIQDV